MTIPLLLILHRAPPRISRSAYRHVYRWYSTEKNAPPLRILFAGSDDFSSTSLKALHREHSRNPSLIASIDVLCREDGRTGRKRDILKEVPIKAVARDLSLPVHTISTFKTWQPPSTPFDLIIAVSFGLFIPADLITSLPFGGLNVHPSLLPRYRGAAPIQRTLLNHDHETGVTIQTLDPQRFDHGSILLQTSPPLPVAKGTSYKTLYDTLAERGAEMLVETLRRGLFIPPLDPVTPKYPPSLARKVTTEDEHIVWGSWSARELQLRAEMFGSVWTELGSENTEDNAPRKRTILSGISVLEWEPPVELVNLPVGCFRYVKRESPWEELMVLRCKDGWVKVGAVKVESKKEIEGGTWIRSLQKRGVGRKFW